jgi:hypothetical protein
MLVDFQHSRFGAIPAEFEFDATGSGPHAQTPRQAFDRPSWRVAADPFAPSPELVLVRAATAPAPDHDPIALLRGVTARDLSASVFIKPMGGGRGSGAGLAWRVRDRDTYQALLADARSHQLRVLAVAGGRPRVLATAPIRIGIEYQRRTPSPAHGWFELRIDVSGERVTAWFDGRRTIELSDPSRLRAGGVGLVTQPDAVAAFDDLHVRYLTRGTGGAP